MVVPRLSAASPHRDQSRQLTRKLGVATTPRARAPTILLDPGSALITSHDTVIRPARSAPRPAPLLTRAVGAALLTQVRQSDPAAAMLFLYCSASACGKNATLPGKVPRPSLKPLVFGLRAGVCALMLLRRYSRGCGLALCCCQSHSERSDDQLCSERRQAVRADTVRLVDAAGQYHAVWRPDAAFLISHLGVGAGASATSGGAP